MNAISTRWTLDENKELQIISKNHKQFYARAPLPPPLKKKKCVPEF